MPRHSVFALSILALSITATVWIPTVQVNHKVFSFFRSKLFQIASHANENDLYLRNCKHFESTFFVRGRENFSSIESHGRVACGTISIQSQDTFVDSRLRLTFCAESFTDPLIRNCSQLFSTTMVSRITISSLPLLVFRIRFSLSLSLSLVRTKQ